MPKTDTSRLFAAYPHLAAIGGKWGTRECRRQLKELMTDTRGGGRNGFPPEHALTLMMLLLEHDREFPEFDDSTTTSWWEHDARSRRER